MKIDGAEPSLLEWPSMLGKAAQIEVKSVKGNGPLSIDGHFYLGSFSFSNECGKYVRSINIVDLEDN
ncbi:hypothetical protein [Bacillus sp. V5-8f]|uniref:hypothetical protein n=1 Tax=Bacillus sp. V5-8f TaxID=2053044 RepID=UPI000C78851C|nr:hypothetical protein [Bacillus sp. V5-8f]PLT35447.1 hypothetical protein CUU64_02210 [Bacillus sp. V5-8f]